MRNVQACIDWLNSNSHLGACKWLLAEVFIKLAAAAPLGKLMVTAAIEPKTHARAQAYTFSRAQA